MKITLEPKFRIGDLLYKPNIGLDKIDLYDIKEINIKINVYGTREILYLDNRSIYADIIDNGSGYFSSEDLAKKGSKLL